MSLKTISSVVIAATALAQILSQARAQLPAIDATKPVRSETLYVFSWPNGYAEIDPESTFNSGVVSNIDFSILDPKLRIDAADATYWFEIRGVIMETDVVTRLQSFGLVNPAGFDVTWPSVLPPQRGPASYTVIDDPVLPPPDDSVRHALDVLHEYYQGHYLELVALAEVRAAPTPTPTPTPPPSATIQRVEYPPPPPPRLR